MSEYLKLAKKAREVTKAANSTEELERRRQRKLEEASRRGLIICWSEHTEWIKIHDPLTGEWHEVRASECPPGVVEAADPRLKKGAVSWSAKRESI